MGANSPGNVHPGIADGSRIGEKGVWDRVRWPEPAYGSRALSDLAPDANRTQRTAQATTPLNVYFVK
jgi:hypothetical protein